MELCLKKMRLPLTVARIAFPHSGVATRAVREKKTPGSTRPSTTSPNPHQKSTWPAMRTHLAGLILYTLHLPSSPSRNPGRRWREAGSEAGAVEAAGARSLAPNAAFAKSVPWISRSLGAVQPRLLHRGALCSRAASSLSPLAPVQPPDRQYPQQHFQQMSHGDVRARPSGKGLKPYQQCPLFGKKKGGGWTKKNGTKYEDDDAPVCSSLLFSVADCVPAPLTLAVLLNVVRLKSTPLGRDHYTAKPVSGFHTKGSPLFCFFFSQQQQWR